MKGTLPYEQRGIALGEWCTSGEGKGSVRASQVRLALGVIQFVSPQRKTNARQFLRAIRVASIASNGDRAHLWQATVKATDQRGARPSIVAMDAFAGKSHFHLFDVLQGLLNCFTCKANRNGRNWLQRQ